MLERVQRSSQGTVEFQSLDAQQSVSVPAGLRRLPEGDRRLPIRFRGFLERKRHNVSPSSHLERRHACAVVAAGKHRELVFDSTTPELVDEHP